MHNLSLNKSKIICQPRCFDSNVDISKQNLVYRVLNACLYYLQSWSGYNDQYCFQKLDERVISTGTTRQMLKNFVNCQATESETKLIQEAFLKKALKDNLYKRLNENTLKTICQNFLEGSNGLLFLNKIFKALPQLPVNESLAKILKLKNSFEIITQLSKNPEVLKQGLTVELLEKMDQLCTELSNIKDPISFQLKRSTSVAQLLINEEGELNLCLIDFLKVILPKSVSPSHNEAFNKTLDKLKNNSEFSKILTSIEVRKNPKNKAHEFVRATLNLGVDTVLTQQHVRQAALSALLMELRQSNTGSCFTTAVAIKIHLLEQERFLEDMKSMIEYGYIYRSEKKLPISPIPFEEMSSASLRNLIEDSVAEECGISQKELNERKKLEKISEPDAHSIPILSSSIKLNDKKWDRYDRIVNYRLLQETAKLHNVLLRGWEYGLAANTKHKVGRYDPWNNKSPIIKVLRGESVESTAGKHYGIDDAFRLFLDEIFKNRTFTFENKRFFFEPGFLTTDFFIIFKELFDKKIKHQYEYGGYKVYDITGLNDVNDAKKISILSNSIEFQDLVGRLVLEAGFELLKENISDTTPVQDRKICTEVIIGAATRLSQYVRTNSFLEHFIRTISKRVEKEENRIKPSDKIPPRKDFKTRFKTMVEGGSPGQVLKTHYSFYRKKSAGPMSSAKKFLDDLLRTLKLLSINKDNEVLMPLKCHCHGFLAMPNHPSLRRAIDSDLHPYDWVEQHVKKQGETIVFADSNWEHDGKRQYFCIAKNEKGKVVFCTMDEPEEGKSNDIEYLKAQPKRELDQDKWVIYKSFRLYTELV